MGDVTDVIGMNNDLERTLVDICDAATVESPLPTGKGSFGYEDSVDYDAAKNDVKSREQTLPAWRTKKRESSTD